jgi:hypothetical protein
VTGVLGVFDVDLAKSFHGDYLGCTIDDPLSNLIRFSSATLPD